MNTAGTRRSRSIPPALQRRRVFRNGPFRRLWAIGSINSTMRWLETLAIGIFVFDQTESAFLVSLIAFLRMVPMLALGIFIGIVADRLNRRQMLIAGAGLLTVNYLVLGLLAVTDNLQLWHVALGTLFTGIVWASDFPVRRAMVGDAVGQDLVGVAMGMDSATNNFTRIIGPVAGGALLAFIGVEGAYFAGTVLFGAGLLLALTIDYTEPSREGSSANPLANMVEGFRYIKSDSVIMVTLVITVVMNLFAFPYQHMVPVMGEEVFRVNPILIGLITSVEGLGATLGALTIALRSKPQHYTRIYLYGSIVFLVVILLFSRTPWYIAALPLLFIGGFGMASFGTMQSVIVLAATPPAVRGRVMGVLAVTIGAGPIGALNIGLLATLFGAPAGIMIISLVGLATLTLTVLLSPQFVRARDIRPNANRVRAAVITGGG